MKLRWIFCLALFAGCGDDGGGDTPDGGNGEPDAPAGNSEPCNFASPQVVELGVAVSADPPSAMCTGGVHYYRFTPDTAGTYTIVKSGGGNVGFCEEENDGGCICGVNINCCSECTLTFDLPDGSPLPAGSNNQIYIDSTVDPGPYTFTVTGPM